MLILTACTNVGGVIQTPSERTPSISDPKDNDRSNPNIVEVYDLTSDCSKVAIPNNVERDTVLDKEKGLLKVYWYDPSKGKDVGVVFRYMDQNCSDSAKQITQHVLQSDSSKNH